MDDAVNVEQMVVYELSYALVLREGGKLSVGVSAIPCRSFDRDVVDKWEGVFGNFIGEHEANVGVKDLS